MASSLETPEELYPCIGAFTHQFFDSKPYSDDKGKTLCYWSFCNQCGVILEIPTNKGERPTILIPKVKR